MEENKTTNDKNSANVNTESDAAEKTAVKNADLDAAVKKKSAVPVIAISAVAVVVVAAVLIAVVLFVSSSGEKRRIADQLALGDRYLSELDYDQAIAAYLAVIEIDPKNKEAYENFVDTYIAWSDATATDGNPDESIKLLENAVSELETLRSEDNNEIIDEQLQRLLNRLEELRGKTPESGGAMSPADELLEQGEYDSALEMYLSMLEEDPENAEAYLGIIEVYLRQGDFDTALQYAEEGYEKTGDNRLKEMIDMINSGNIKDSRGNILSMTQYREGRLEYRYEYSYDKDGREVTQHTWYYSSDGNIEEWYSDSTYDDLGRNQATIEYFSDGGRYEHNYSYTDDESESFRIDNIHYDAGGDIIEWSYDLYEHGRREHHELDLDNNRNDRLTHVDISTYDENGREVRRDSYHYYEDREEHTYSEIIYDENGNWIGEKEYDDDGVLIREYLPEY